MKKIEGALVFTTMGYWGVSGFNRIKARLDDAMSEAAREEARAAGRDPDAVTIAPWVLHDLRRTCATGMAEIGIQPHIVEAVLNHVSGAKAGVAGIYNQYAYLPEKKTALERWAAHVQGLAPGRRLTSCHLRKRPRHE